MARGALRQNCALLFSLIMALFQCLAKANSIEFDNKNGTFPPPPLISAVLRGNITLVGELLAKGADPDLINRTDGLNALHVAARDSKDGGQIVKMLLAHGAHIDKRTEGRTGETALQLAAAQNQVNNTIVLLDAGACIDCANSNGSTPLMEAIYYNATDVAKLLIQRGANVNATMVKDKMSALHIAVFNGLSNIVAILLQQNADANAKARYNIDPDGQLYLTPLLMALEKQVNNAENIARLLLAYGADVNATYKAMKWTPLHFAVRYRNSGLVSLLLEHHANPNAKALYDNDFAANGQGTIQPYVTPLLVAIYSNSSLEISRLLLAHGAEVNTTFKVVKWTPLHFAVRYGNSGLVSLLLEHHVNPNAKALYDSDISANGEATIQPYVTPLMVAINNNSSLEIFRLLLAHGADVNVTSKIVKWTPLHFAVGNGHIRVVELLLEYHANPNAKALYNNDTTANVKGTNIQPYVTPLMVAVDSNSSLEIIQLLLSYGADVTSSDKVGKIPLHNAASFGFIGISKILLEYGSDVNATSKAIKWTPLHFAVRNGHTRIVEFLLEYHANPNAKALFDDDLKVTNADEYNADLNAEARQIDGPNDIEPYLTPLMIAAQFNKSLEISRILLDKDVDVNPVDRHGWTPLHYAVNQGESKLVELLLQFNANPNAKAFFDGDEQKNITTPYLTPLLLAIINEVPGSFEISNILLEHGAEVASIDDEGLSPLHRAAERGFTKIADLLIRYGADPNIANLKKGDSHEGWTPLHYATLLIHKDTVELLLDRGASPNLKAYYYDITQPKIVGPYLMPLNLAINLLDYGALEIAQLLLEHGAKVNDRDNQNLTLLHRVSSMHINSTALIKLLIDNGADVNALSNGNFTALDYALMAQNLHNMRLLIERGANISLAHYSGPSECRSIKGLCILNNILRHMNGVKKKVESQYAPIAIGIEQMLALIPKQTDASITKARGIPILLAQMNGKGESVKILKNNTDPNQANECGKTLLHYATEYLTDEHIFRLLLEHGANVNASTKDTQFTPLHLAAQFNKAKFGRLLLKWGAYVNALAKNGLSPLIIATLFNSTEMAKLLIDHGANVNDSNNTLQWTPLHLASLLGNNEIIRILIRKGADVNAAPNDQETHTALFFATNSNATETAKLLLNSGAFTNGTAFEASARYAKRKNWQTLVKLLSERASDQQMLRLILRAVDGANLLTMLSKNEYISFTNDPGWESAIGYGLLLLYIASIVSLILGLCGNLLLISTIICSKLLQNHINKYIVVLLASDSVFILWWSCTMFIVQLNETGPWVCFASETIAAGVFLISSNLIVLLTMERFFVIMFPFQRLQYGHFSRWKLIFICLFPMQLWNIVYQLLPYTDGDLLEYFYRDMFLWNIPNSKCWSKNIFALKYINIPFFISIFFLPLFTVFCGNAAILIKICTNRIESDSTTDALSVKNARRESSKNKVPLILPALYAVISAPFLLYIALLEFGVVEDPAALRILGIICVFPYYCLNFVFNWLIYALASSNFRKLFVKFWSEKLAAWRMKCCR